jgi:nucleoside-diphosphate kinase
VQRTLIIVKPHAVDRGLAGTFLERFERMGLRIVAIRTVKESAAFWDNFYPSDAGWFSNVARNALENCKQNGIDVHKELGTEDPARIGRLIKDWLVDHMQSGTSIAAVLEGNEASVKVRCACGSTLPNKAAPGTIRFDFSVDSPTPATAAKRPLFNLIHSSNPDEVRGTASAAEYEIKLVFPELA